MFDAEIGFLLFLQGARTDFLNIFFEFITTLGEETILVIIMAFTYFMFDKKLASKILFITSMSLGINGIIKNFVKRPRPFATGKIICLRADTATGYAFPSGHTQNFATWSMGFAYHLKKRWMIICSVLLTASLGFSRMYLGAHYPADVISGAALGFLFAVCGNILYDRCKSKNALHYSALALMVPFAIYFLYAPDPLFEDFFKFMGLYTGFVFAYSFEEKFVGLEFDSSFSRKLIRVVCATLVAYILNKLFKTVIFSGLRISLLWDLARYMILSFTVFALCSLAFKKLRL